METTTTTNPRAAILEARLQLLNGFILYKTQKDSNINFGQYLDLKGITYNDFIQDLPGSLKNPPIGNDPDKFIAYTTAMNDEYVKQMGIVDDGAINAKGTAFSNADGTNAPLIGGNMGYLSKDINYYNVFYGPGLYPETSAA